MTKYCVDRVDRTLPARTRDRSRNGTALLSARRLIIDLVAGEARVRTVGADVLLECPHCLNVRVVGAATQAEERSVHSGKYAVDAVVWGSD